MSEASESLKHTFFPNYDGNLLSIMYEVTMFLSKVSYACLKYDAFISLFGISLNIVHFIVLSRENMRKWSSNVIMIGLVISDIGSMIICIFKYYRFYWEDDGPCRGPYTYWEMISIKCQNMLADFFRRYSPLLVIIMATVRTLLVRNAKNIHFKVLSTAKCGWICVAFGFLSSIWVSGVQWVAGDIVIVMEGTPWKPSNTCTEFPVNYTRRAFNTIQDPFLLSLYTTTDALTSKIFPCLGFPVLTAILVISFNRAMKLVGNGASMSHGKENDRGERTTRIVIYMTVSFMITMLPQGICTIISGFNYKKHGIRLLADSINEIFVLLQYINSLSHGIFCYAMSEKYRSTFKKVFLGESKAAFNRNTNSIITGSSKQSTSSRN